MSDAAGPRLGLVSFVGAGPGDPELITVKGLARLRQAEVVVHDRLVPRALLAGLDPAVEVIDAGKAAGRPRPGQGEINRLLVDRARRGRRVVRLKGGDPALFARLAEEIRALRAAGVPFEIVPGVTAATAAAAAAGVSLTERGRASTVLLAPGADHAGRPAALDWGALARLEGTLVFYMPIGALEDIAAALTALGRDPREPATLVAGAGTPAQRILTGRLDTIAAQARLAGVAPPATLLIGPPAAGGRGSSAVGAPGADRAAAASATAGERGA